MTNNCGSCTMCCKLLGVKELTKPMNSWCTHCAVGHGCKIYDTRPRSCQEFECLYLQHKNKDPLTPVVLRPDKSKVVIWELDSTRGDRVIKANVDPGHPMAWQDDPVHKLLVWFAKNGYTVMATTKARSWHINADGSDREMIMRDEGAIQYFVRYVDEPAVSERG